MIIKSFPPKKTEKVIPEIPVFEKLSTENGCFCSKIKEKCKNGGVYKNFL